ncbi:MAG TPA: TIM-barrel domain-containing protein [Galbitalea sp.]|nr:TIM-barrel domain-containing protein [Galbitalea sp.]
MIRHRPFGSGHPYSVDTEQRSPVDPVAGEPLLLGVRTSPDVVGVRCELEITSADGRSHERAIELEPVARSSRGQTVDGGHLAGAQARLVRAAGGWQVTLDDLRAADVLRYRFVGTIDSSRSQNTRWFDVRVAAWRSANTDQVAAIGGSRLAGPVEVLDDGLALLRIRFSIAVDPREHVSGFGERFDRVDQRAASLDSVVFEQYKSQGAERKTYLPMPFAHVTGVDGWGFHVRSSRRVWFDIGATDPSRIAIEAELDAEREDSPAITVAFYSGTPTQVLNAFLEDVGRPAELPSWVFRLWASGNEWNTQAEVLRQAALHREHDIPIGTMVIEAWSDESTFTAFRDARYQATARPHVLADYTFPADGAWPDPRGMVDELHGDDVRLVLWQIPLIKMRPHPSGQAEIDAGDAVKQNVLIREVAPDGSLRPYRNRGWWFPLGLMPDLTDDRAATWWTNKRRYLVDELGIDGFKTDGGEHAWGRDLRYLDGKHGDEGNNLFPVAYAKAYGDLLESAGKPPVTFSRAGFTGSQAHGAFWAGDENSTWDAFRWSLTAGLTASASGILYWGWDIGGFSGDLPTPELYLRSAAAAAFVPIMQYHSEFNHHRLPLRDRTPWNVAEESGDDRVIPVFRRFVQVRERLNGYLVEQAASAIARGEPLMRPLFFDFPGDEQVWLHPLQWMLGSDLLVAPVTEEGRRDWDVYLPEGVWVDAWTGESVTGGRVVNRPAPIDEVPVYVRGDSWSTLRSAFADS